MITVQLFDGTHLKRSHCSGGFSESLTVIDLALQLHWQVDVADPSVTVERRSLARQDRRKHSRSGRRAEDPHTTWRRVYWLFGAYALYLSVRKIPSTLRRFWRRETVAQ